MHVMTSKWQGRKVQERAINKFSFLSHENGQIQREITKEKALKRISTLPSGFHLTFNWTRHFASHAYFTIKGRRHLKYYPKIHPCYGNSINITWQLEEALDPLLMLYLWHQCFRSLMSNCYMRSLTHFDREERPLCLPEQPQIMC